MPSWPLQSATVTFVLGESYRGWWEACPQNHCGDPDPVAENGMDGDVAARGVYKYLSVVGGFNVLCCLLDNYVRGQPVCSAVVVLVRIVPGRACYVCM